MNKKESFEEWAILELMGHRKLAGLVTEQTIGSASFIRIDVPNTSGGFKATQFYNPSAVYCMTPTNKETAIQTAKGNEPRPVEKWELLPEPQETERGPFSEEREEEEDANKECNF